MNPETRLPSLCLSTNESVRAFFGSGEWSNSFASNGFSAQFDDTMDLLSILVRKMRDGKFEFDAVMGVKGVRSATPKGVAEVFPFESPSGAILAIRLRKGYLFPDMVAMSFDSSGEPKNELSPEEVLDVEKLSSILLATLWHRATAFGQWFRNIQRLSDFDSRLSVELSLADCAKLMERGGGVSKRCTESL